jgi:phosphotransferase system enzyme I (PtsI)
MKELQGISASAGIAIGTVCIYQTGSGDNIDHYNISPEQADNEIKRLDAAFKKAETKIREMKEISGKLFGKQGNDIIGAHLSILNDENLKKKVEKDIRKNLVNAEHAVEDVFADYSKRLEGKGLHFEEITHDIYDVRDRLFNSFAKEEEGFACPAGEKQPVIAAAEKLTPSMVVSIDPSHVLAFVTKTGGITSHATILARTLNIPVVFDIDVDAELQCRCKAIVDGSLGKVIVEPDSETVRRYKKQQKKYESRKKLCEVIRTDPTRTAEGERINLKVNISALAETELLKTAGSADAEKDMKVHYDGVGLLRTEFIFMRENEPPGEEYQYKIYKDILEAAGGRHVVARMLDLSADKMPGFISLPPGVDDFMDIRGATAVLAYRDIYLTQARALLRASAEGEIKLLFPMVSDLGDYYIYKELIDDARKTLDNDGIKHGSPEMGIMFETPSSALLAEQFFREIDFANIGTNDLLQYLVASSRTDKISNRRYHILHPSVVRMLQIIAEAAQKSSKEACLCGEIAGFELYYPVLLDAGIKSFSVPAAKFEEIKCELLHLEADNYKGQAGKYLTRKSIKDQTSFFEK